LSGLASTNFKGPKDQRIAFDILERLFVVSQEHTVKACKTLLDRIDAELAKGKPVFHCAHETSGALLVRVLEKDLEIAKDRILRPHDFEAPPMHESGSVIVIWDRFNGTGKQLRTQLERYRPIFDKSQWKQPIVCFAYIAGHPVNFELPSNVRVLRAIEDVPSVHDENHAEQKELCDRYSSIANTQYDTGALIAFADNVPNNVPVILLAPPDGSKWRLLFKRKPTKYRSRVSSSSNTKASVKRSRA
jgi:hypothetical protein